MDNPLNVRDASLSQSKALPAAAGSAQTTAIDLAGGSDRADFVADVDLQIVAPALTVTELPNTKTAIYDVETSANNSDWVKLVDNAITQTGAGGAGAAAVTKNVPLRGTLNGTSGNIRRYVRVNVTTSAGAGDCSGSSVIARLVF